MSSTFHSCSQVGSTKPVMQHQAAAEILCKAVPFAELPNTQILPDLARFQEICQLLGSERSLDGWKFLYAWLETAAAWLTWRQNPAPHFCMSNAAAAPCTQFTWAGRGAGGKGASPGSDRTRVSKTGGDRTKAAGFVYFYLHNGLQLFYMFFKDLCNQISCMCRF